ncbi:transporter substrate-binding domain-containing protein [Ramlibacter rhizophilus]|uniref:Transporter substrate-binding domain-containing protein n=1 Tax=Ramlibacter rhizophilus TaxID=1781167 RepID=A0A4Z0BVB6_9BURK|nr:transporter substrate-binding domain-containing protein [Ramlibacter rhizophilus]TFZ03256.1 transporter substrate-binding domain-containing protein [Ramlibacter rhizophilus]
MSAPLRWVACALACCGLLAPAARADRLDDIVQRGTLIVGVKKDVPLWGQRGRQGVPEGLEPDLAADLARRLGVKLELVGLLSSDRMDAMAQRRVDVMIATFSDTPERRRQLALVRPHYYASGVNVMVRRQTRFRAWTELRHHRVCGRRGAFYNRAITVAHGVDVVALHSNQLALAALRDGRCDAVLYDDTNIVALLQDPAWARGFEMPLPTVQVVPWAIALHPEEAGGRLEALVSRAVVEWHRSGELIRLERKWGIPVSAFSRRMNTQWNRRLPSGEPYCGEWAGPRTPADCL